MCIFGDVGGGGGGRGLGCLRSCKFPLETGRWGCKGGALYPVKVVEGRAELVHLLLADALGVTGQDLALNLIDGASDGGEEQLPAHTNVLRTKGSYTHTERTNEQLVKIIFISQVNVFPFVLELVLVVMILIVFVPCFLRARFYLHGVVGVLVVKHQRLLNELVVSL